MKFNIQNRRYVGSKYKISDEIIELIYKYCEGNIFLDLFAGTGIMSMKMLDSMNDIIINDFLYSNEVIYKGFFQNNDNKNIEKLEAIVNDFNNLEVNNTDNYFERNFGGRYFSENDASKIGYIRSGLDNLYVDKTINNDEFNTLLASLLYSVDKIANTVGHYDAYRKKQNIKDKFQYRLIELADTKNKKITIIRKDANELVKKLDKVDITFIDPPYNSRQYSRFYHVLENLTTWDKPELFGVAMKPEPENMSEYCKSKAKYVFKDLIDNLNSKYIVVTYNNTYNSKSSSSRNKIELLDLEKILSDKGIVKKFSLDHKFFNTGKTDFSDHKEFVYIVEVQ